MYQQRDGGQEPNEQYYDEEEDEEGSLGQGLDLNQLTSLKASGDIQQQRQQFDD